VPLTKKGLKICEKLAEKYADRQYEIWEEYAQEMCIHPWQTAMNDFLAGYHSRDEEVKQLKEEIAMFKSDLREGFGDE